MTKQARNYLGRLIIFNDLEITPIPDNDTAIHEARVERVSDNNKYVYIQGGWMLWKNINLLGTVK